MPNPHPSIVMAAPPGKSGFCQEMFPLGPFKYCLKGIGASKRVGNLCESITYLHISGKVRVIFFSHKLFVRNGNVLMTAQ
jgi:hypothetical protein